MVSLKGIFDMKFVYLLAGIGVTVGNQLLSYQGVGGRYFTIFTGIPTYIGMFLAIIIQINSSQLTLPSDTKKQSKSPSFSYYYQLFSKHKSNLIILSLIDFTGAQFSSLGLYYAGSGVYQVFYSSITIFIALQSTFLLKKSISKFQWLAVIIISLGLCSSAFGNSLLASENNNLTIGITCTIICTGCFSFTYVWSEKLLKGGIKSLDLCVLSGILGLINSSIYSLFVTIPNRFKLIDQVAEREGNWNLIFLIFAMICLISIAHNASYFIVIERIGSTSTGVMQGIRAIAIFIISSLLFCSINQQQCFTIWKFISSVIVILGVILYSSSPIDPLIRKSPKTKISPIFDV